MILYNYLNNINNNSIENLEIFEHTILEDYKKEIKMNDDYNICFVISCKYNRSYVTYIKYYVDNIIKYYTNYLIIIIDNNSIYIDELISLFNFLNYKNIIILINDIECKFEIGAYKMGIIYLFKNNLIDKYDYYVFSQDNFVLKNKYDFNILKNNNIYVAPINYLTVPSDYDNIHPWLKIRINEIMKQQVNIIDNSYDFLHGCWCHSFILHQSKIIDFYNITKNIIITNRLDSVCSEFYLPNILSQLNDNKLNDYKLFTIDGNSNYYNGIHHNIKYDIYSKYINIDSHYFEKKFQSKNENTVENFFNYKNKS